MIVRGSHAREMVTIASGETDSEAIPFDEFAQCIFVLPADFTGTAVSFKVSPDGETFTLFYDSTNALVSQPVTQGRAYAFPVALFPARSVKIVSNAAEAAGRTIEIASKY